MSTVQEIEAVLPQLSAVELRQVVRQADQLFRQKLGGTIDDDHYGTVSDQDLIVAGDEAFLAYARAEAALHEGPAR